MEHNEIQDILANGGPELETLKENLEQLTGFLKLVEAVDKLSDMDRRVSEEGLSLYHAVSKKHEMAVLESIIHDFFGEPAKRAGEPFPDHLADNLTVSFLGGIKDDQTLFLKKIGQSEFFGALFPWQRKVNVITVHLGLYNAVMPEHDYEKLKKLVAETIAQRVSEEVESGLAGQVQGISLPSFLQMSEMEGSTCSLRIRSGENIGMLHLLNGNLIDAEAGELRHKEAAYAIVAWDNPTIEIRKAVGRTKNEIKVPLMHLLMDSLRLKDQQEFEKDAPPQKSPQTSPPQKTGRPGADTWEAPGIEMAEKAKKKAAPTRSKPRIDDDKPDAASKAAPSREKTAPMPETATTVSPKKTDPAEAVIDDGLVQKDVGGRKRRPRLGKPTPKLKPKKKLPMLIAAGVAILVMCGIGFYIFDSLLGGGVSEYRHVLKKVTRLQDVDAQEKLLMDFIDSHEPGEDTAKAEAKLREIWQQNEAANYQKTIDAVNQLPVDRSFEEKAKALYADFLERYPNTRHKDDIDLAISEMSGLSEDVIFSELKNLKGSAYIDRIRACEDYLSLYPQGKYREAVKKMFSETLGDAYSNFKREVTLCERAATWDDCLKICDDHLAVFSGYIDSGEVIGIRKRIQMEKDFADLERRTSDVEKGTAKRLYTAYMAQYPDSPHNKAIQEALLRLEKEEAAGQQWTSIKKSLQRSDIRLQTKIDRVEAYLSQNSSGPQAAEAEAALRSLEEEAAQRSVQRQKVLKAQEAEERAKKEAEEKYAALVKRQAERTRINTEKQKVLAALSQAQGRFVPEGDSAVKDRRTGLMWGLLDSQREIGVCLDYRAATRYVADLRYNGYDDWRLPTSSELAGIYKNKPYFPASGAQWYWTSEVFAKGYSYIVNTVSAKQEPVFKKIPQDVTACGTVRAVRP